jgi:hypothetical protein
VKTFVFFVENNTISYNKKIANQKFLYLSKFLLPTIKCNTLIFWLVAFKENSSHLEEFSRERTSQLGFASLLQLTNTIKPFYSISMDLKVGWLIENFV